jgi:transcriptional regulator with XRE-family HTH domain
MSIVGDNLRRERQARGKSQRALGQALGHAGSSYISAVESGRKHPSEEMLARIASHLGLRPEDLKRPPHRL